MRSIVRCLLLLCILWQLVYGQTATDTTKLNPTECGRRFNDSSKIVGGVQAQRGDWPWQIALYRKRFLFYDFTCGGSLINSQWIVTAAHCISSLLPSRYEIDLGVWNKDNPESWSQTRKVIKLFRHENYNSNTMKNDIALLKLSTPIKYSKYILPVCVPQSGYNVPTGSQVIATGWGATSQSDSSSTMMQVNFTTISESDCNKANRNQVDYTSQICAGEPNGNKDTCQGDSGGPLVTKDANNNKWQLAGITSWGFGCTGAGVYTRASNYYSWILDKIQNN